MEKLLKNKLEIKLLKVSVGNNILYYLINFKKFEYYFNNIFNINNITFINISYKLDFPIVVNSYFF